MYTDEINNTKDEGINIEDQNCNEENQATSLAQNDDPLLSIHDYVSEVAKITKTYDKSSYHNALILNKALQKIAINMRNKLQDMLHKINEQYQRNIKLLTENKGEQITQPTMGFSACGSPFFKDDKMFNAPHNHDYERRKQMGEFFPMDLQQCPQHRWTLGDKFYLVQGIRKQAINYLESGKVEKDATIVAVKRYKNERLAELLEQVGNNLDINWYKLSTEDLDARHSENECYAMWNSYLRPGLKRDEWTAREEAKLMDLVCKHSSQGWDKIAKEMENRSEYQCFVHFQTNLSYKALRNSQKWTKEDDETLIKAVEASRVGSVIHWSKVMSFFPHKLKRQVYGRYKNTVDPQIYKEPFSREEDCILMAAIQEYGEENLSCIPITLFPGRTATQIRQRYMNVLRHGKVQRYWTVEDDKMLLEFVQQNGTSSWVEASKLLEGHSRTSCRTRFIVIKKYFQKNPNASIEDIPRKKKGVLSGVNIDNWTEKMIDLKLNGDVKKQETLLRRERLKKRKNFSYINKLRPIERKYHDFFKFSYNIQFMESPNTLEPSIKNLLYLYNNVGANICVEKLKDKQSRGSFTQKETELLVRCLKKSKPKLSNDYFYIRDKHYVPINWCTMLGIRGLSVLHGVHQKTHKKRSFSSIKNVLPLAKFESRFVQIFYMTALLSKFKPEETTVNSIFQIKFVESEPTESVDLVLDCDKFLEEENGKRKASIKQLTNSTKKRKCQ